MRSECFNHIAISCTLSAVAYSAIRTEGLHEMASIQRIVSPLIKDVSYRAQVRVKGRASESQTFPNLKEAKAWAASIETAIREGRHFPHAAARRTNFDAMAKDYVETVLAEFDRRRRRLGCGSSSLRPSNLLASR